MKNLFSCLIFCISVVVSGCAQKTPTSTNNKPADVQSSAGGQMRSGIIMYDGLAFGLTSPQGWVLDTESGSSNGVPAVVYPEGSSWKDSRTVMYANVTAKNGGETIDSLVGDDIQRFKDGDSHVVISDLPQQTVGKKQVTVKSFFGKSPENYEAVAYIDEKEHVVFLVLSARNMAEYEASLPLFSELVGSYFYMGKQ